MKLIIKAIYMCMAGIFVSMSVPAHSETASASIKDLIANQGVVTSITSPGDIVKGFEDEFDFLNGEGEVEDDWAFLVRKTALCGVNKLFKLDTLQMGDKEVRGLMKQYDDERLSVINVTDARYPDGQLDDDNYCCRDEIGYFQSEYIVLLMAKAGDGSKLIKLNLDGTFVSAVKVKNMFGPRQYYLSESEVADLIIDLKEFWKDYFQTEPNPVSD